MIDVERNEAAYDVVKRAGDLEALAAFLAACTAEQGTYAEYADCISRYMLGLPQLSTLDRMTAAVKTRPDMAVEDALFDAGFGIADVLTWLDDVHAAIAKDKK